MSEIPHRLIYLWTGKQLPYYARLSVESALLADPKSQVYVYTFETTNNLGAHFDAIFRYTNVSHLRVDTQALFASLPHGRALSALYRSIPSQHYSARSNLVRYGVLHRDGGVYLDFDTIIMRSLRGLLSRSAFIGRERVWKIDQDRVAGAYSPRMLVPGIAFLLSNVANRLATKSTCLRDALDQIGPYSMQLWSDVQYNNAVIGAQAGSQWTASLLRAAVAASPTVRYALGPALVSKTPLADADALPMDYFYCVPPSQSYRLFAEDFALPTDAYLIHYVASNHGRILSTLSDRRIHNHRSNAPFYRLARSVMERRHTIPTGFTQNGRVVG